MPITRTPLLFARPTFPFAIPTCPYLQKEEDPGTACCFCYRENPVNRTKTFALAIERNARGRRQQRRSGRSMPAYMRLVRPATGFSAQDIPYKVRKVH